MDEKGFERIAQMVAQIVEAKLEPVYERFDRIDSLRVQNFKAFLCVL